MVWCCMVWLRYDMLWCGVVWCGVMCCGYGMICCGVVWCGMVWCDVLWLRYDMVWLRYDMLWCGVVWCGYGMICCGVVLCSVVLYGDTHGILCNFSRWFISSERVHHQWHSGSRQQTFLQCLPQHLDQHLLLQQNNYQLCSKLSTKPRKTIKMAPYVIVIKTV